jgi:prepilin-type N-terminal cleavage/methylation domain-containing protein
MRPRPPIRNVAAFAKNAGGGRTRVLGERGYETGTPRRGFTLLEVLLAATIGVLLMGALYVAVDIQVRNAQAGRDLVEQSALGRALLARIASDISPCVGQIDPSRFKSSGSSASGGGSTITTTGSTSTTTTPASGTSSGTTSSTSTTTTGSTPGSSTTTTSSPTSSTFTFSLQGDSSSLTLYVSLLPRDVDQQPGTMAANSADAAPINSDVRRISYWLAGGSDGQGLARQELLLATSDDASTLPPNIPDEASLVIAPEVKTLAFSYFDGSDWQDSWDGTQPGPDGVTPIGPPLAVAITIGIAPPNSDGRSGSGQKLKTYRHVVAIPTANFGAAQSTNGTTP